MSAPSADQDLRSRLSFPEELPITEHRRELVDAITNNQVLIVAGETGSGKSTQLPKLCVEAGRGTSGMIGHTQPRRLAARSIAERICEETASELGDEVGFSVRFNDRIGPRTRIRLMTDGILLAELQHDRKLRRYDTIIIDEAHERSLNIDFILGYLHQLLPRRPDLHVIVTSATIDVERFSRHFDEAPVIEVSGRTYPVEIRYRPYDTPEVAEPLSQVEAIVQAVAELTAEGPGDMLVFLPGERDIRETAEALVEAGPSSTEIFPLYARLSSAEQHRVFQPHRGRRIVLATNVAETSVTVPGIRYVIDPGNARISRFNPRTKVQRLPIEEISQASADQRAGRCGRIGPGICVRLYSQDDYQGRDEFTEPEILRTNLASVILQMASLGLGDIASFPFVEPPEDRGVRDGIALLEELDALDPERHGTRQWLTPLGRELARLPVDPRFARMIIEAADHGALAEVIIIVAALSIRDPRERPTDQMEAANQAHREFADADSDFLTLLNLWRHIRRRRSELSRNQFRKDCRRRFLSYNRIREWEDTQRQLTDTAAQLGYRAAGNRAKPDTVHRSLLAGLLSHVGMQPENSKKGGDTRTDKGRGGRQRSRSTDYLGARGARFRLGRDSVLADQPPRWVMAAELIETNQMWARMAAPIDPRWAEDLGYYLVARSYSDPVWAADDGVAYTKERVTLYGLPIVAGRRCTVGSVNPELGRELFIHHALVEGDWATTHTFAARNEVLRAELRELEIRARQDLLVDIETVHRFFDQRLPDDVTSAAHFNAWWKRQRSTKPELLLLHRNDLVRPDVASMAETDFPDHWSSNGAELELAYHHDQSSALDGVSVHVPIEVLNQLEPGPFVWTVPGLRPHLVSALVRSLPKHLRRPLNPVPDTVAAVSPKLATARHERPFDLVLADALSTRAGTPIEPADFDWSKVPDHLRPTFRVINPDRQLVAEGKDLNAIKSLLVEHTRTAIAELSRGRVELTRSGITAWDFGDLPTEVETPGPSHTIRSFPTLVDEGTTVGIELRATADEQADEMWLGTRKLLRLQLPSPVRTVDKLMDNRTKLALTSHPVQSRAQWYNDAIDCSLDDVIADGGGPAWTEQAFEHLLRAARSSLRPRLIVATDAVERLAPLTAELDRRLAVLADTDTLGPSVNDAAAHFRRLVYPGFLAGIGFDHLTDLGRFLEAIGYRLDRLADNPRSDLLKAAECVAVEQKHRRLVDQLGLTIELEEIVWQLEELRVAQFAQHLRQTGPSAVKVSARRIERRLDRLAGKQ